jgi:hypothetical protein
MWILRSVVLVLAVFVTACGDTAPTPAAPTPTPSQTQTPTPPPTSTFDLSPFVGVWNLTLHLTEVKGDSGCIAEAMKSQLEVPSKSSLTITKNTVTITNPLGDYACTFDSFKTEGSSFTTYGVQGWFTCQRPTLAVRCSNGSTYELFSWGQDISARLSGTEISGTWDSVFDYSRTGVGLEVTAEFKGSR